MLEHQTQNSTFDTVLTNQLATEQPHIHSSDELTLNIESREAILVEVPSYEALSEYLKRRNAEQKFYSRKRTAVGSMAMLNGVCASVEYYFLGMSLIKRFDIPNSVLASVAQHLFGLISFVPNSSMNILVNKEIAHKIYDKATNGISSAAMKQLLYRLPVLAHASVSSFTITILVLESTASAHIALRCLLGVSSFLSNSAIFYYTDMDAVHALINSGTYYKNDRSLRDINNALHAYFSHMKSEILDLSFPDNGNLVTLDDLIAKVASCDWTRIPPKPRYSKLKIASAISGAIIGSFAVSGYYNVGYESTIALCRMLGSEECFANNEFMSTALGISTFTAYILFSVDQSIGGCAFMWEILHHMLTKCDSLFWFSAIILLSMASSMPNVAITMEYLIDDGLTTWLTILLIASAFLGPTLVNAKWFNGMASDAFAIISARISKGACPNGAVAQLAMEQEEFLKNKNALLQTTDRIIEDLDSFSPKHARRIHSFFSQGHQQENSNRFSELSLLTIGANSYGS